MAAFTHLKINAMKRRPTQMVMAPVNPKAQRRVPLPPGVDLNQPLNLSAPTALYDPQDQTDQETVLTPCNMLAEVRQKQTNERKKRGEGGVLMFVIVGSAFLFVK
jgi:hypothetical protein